MNILDEEVIIGLVPVSGYGFAELKTMKCLFIILDQSGGKTEHLIITLDRK